MSLTSDLLQILAPRQVLTRSIDRIAFSSDASFYRLVPQAVVQPKTVEEVRQLFRYSRQKNMPLVFRAAGTSLSGQSVTDGILVDISRYWRKITIEHGGNQVRLEPGVIGSDANLALKPLLRRIGPDPASIDAAQLGGMVANNSSGMCCGVVENAYHTLASMTFLLPDGSLVDTAAPDAAAEFSRQAPQISEGILQLRREILADAVLCERIRAKYKQKNTTGYALNAFLDYEQPHQILAHLMVGSEGTLGFIAEVILHTLPAYPLKYTGLLLFASVRQAADAVFPLRDSGARAIEFMDRAALRSVEQEEGIAHLLQGLPQQAAALLVEYQCSTASEMAIEIEKASAVCSQLPLLKEAQFTSNPSEQALLWKIRKGLYPSIGGMRRQGTTVLIEDVAFQVEQLADATADLQALFVKHHFPEAIIFGHAKDGNLHFVLTPSFESEDSIAQYRHFMDDVVELVVKKYNGVLKAEHGTGRNMAPFVETEWGSQAYAIMQRLKTLVDPENLLNPGVILNDDPLAHLKHLKPWAQIEEEADQCVECGFCEPKCPSRDLTLTPRRRIVVRREIAHLQRSGENPQLLADLLKDYQYDGLDTCAVDGYCAIACPVHINTGLLVKRLRAEQISLTAQHNAARIARHFSTLEAGLRIAVGLGHAAEKVIGVRGVTGISLAGEAITRSRLPKWSAQVPAANFSKRPTGQRELAAAVYFPTCIARIMGTSPGKPHLTVLEAVSRIAARAGMPVWVPPDSPGNCCGMPFSSKGYTQAFKETLSRTLERFWEWSDEGRLPIVVDSSSCAYTLLTSRQHLSPADQDRYDRLTLFDPIDFVYTLLLPKLTIQPLQRSIVLHPNCSAVKLNLAEKMSAVARACAASVTIPANLRCCGFAGDRGLLFPELTTSATRLEASEINSREYDGYYSSNLTCEMGMAQATGKPYQSLLFLVEEATR